MLATKRDPKLEMQSAIVLEGGSDCTTNQRISDFVEDLDQAMSFMTHWSMGSVLGLKLGQRRDRWGINVELSERSELRRRFSARVPSASPLHQCTGRPRGPRNKAGPLSLAGQGRRRIGGRTWTALARSPRLPPRLRKPRRADILTVDRFLPGVRKGVGTGK